VLRAPLLAVLLVTLAADPTGTGGGTVDSWIGTIEQDEAVVHGSGSGSSRSETSARGGDNDEGQVAAPPEPSTPDSAPCPVGTFGCDPRDDYRVTVVTLADIARFRPAPGVQRMEPDGWVVVGLPANIYSIVDTQIVAGELLGQSADVRFTPVAWQWNYGDGTAATLPTRGGTWAALGLREFDATPTSHIYQRAGSYTIRLSIVYRAEYRIAGGPFTPIAGTITLPANELHITASGAKTVLVDRDCTVAPRGPGC
jgi:hypothetical protein